MRCVPAAAAATATCRMKHTHTVRGVRKMQHVEQTTSRPFQAGIGGVSGDRQLTHRAESSLGRSMLRRSQSSSSQRQPAGTENGRWGTIQARPLQESTQPQHSDGRRQRKVQRSVHTHLWDAVKARSVVPNIGHAHSLQGWQSIRGVLPVPGVVCEGHVCLLVHKWP